MKKLLLRARQAPALVIAVLALVAAVAGVAIANPSAFTSGGPITKKKVKKISKNVADSEIGKLAPGLTVSRANALTAYGHVSTGGGVSQASGLGTVTRPAAGIYCFNGMPRTPLGGEATVDYNDSPIGYTAQIAIGRDITGFCPAGTQAAVGVQSGGSSPSGQNAGFFVEFWS